MRKTFLILFIALLAASCVDEPLTRDPAATLSFSVDTLDMDTAFGATSTWRFMVYNPNAEAIRIDRVAMAGGESSPFRFNIDGRRADGDNAAYNITIRARDSLYVLVEATRPELAPDCALLSDSLIFTANGHRQLLPLRLVGRNGRLLSNYRLTGDETLTAGRPYLVEGNIYVPEGMRLTIEAGAELYMHADANIVVDGELTIDGTPERRVILRGDRFDNLLEGTTRIPYRNIPGQWGGIYLQNAHSVNIMRWADIIGMGQGIALFGTGRSTPKLTVESSRVHCSEGYGIYAELGNVEVVNTEISNCGQSCLLAIGGSTLLRHATIADYYTFASRKNAAVRIIGYIDNYGIRTAYPVDRCVVENSIIYGRNYCELELLRDTALPAAFNLFVSHTALRMPRSEEAWFDACLFGTGENDIFVSTEADYDAAEPTYFDFRLSEQSEAKGAGDARISALVPLTLDGKERTSADLGAY